MDLSCDTYLDVFDNCVHCVSWNTLKFTHTQTCFSGESRAAKDADFGALFPSHSGATFTICLRLAVALLGEFVN